MSSRRPMTRAFSANGRVGSINEEDMPAPSARPDSRNYLLNVRPENSYTSHRYSCYKPSRSTLCSVMAQLTEETQPSFETTLKTKAVSEYSNVKFSCEVSGYPVPELTWYKDDMELDRYCGLPKYEIFRNGKVHTLHIYNCTIEDAAIYQASARNSKGIVSCSGVLEVGDMNEFKIHQKFFHKLKLKADNKRKEMEENRRRERGKENVQATVPEQPPHSLTPPERPPRKRRSPSEPGLRGAPVPQGKEAEARARAQAEARLHDGTGEDGVEQATAAAEMPNGFPSDARVAPVSDPTKEAAQENGNQDLMYIYETVEIVTTTRRPTKEPSATKRPKISNGVAGGEVSNGTAQGQESQKDECEEEGMSLVQYLAESLKSQESENKGESEREAMEVDVAEKEEVAQAAPLEEVNTEAQKPASKQPEPANTNSQGPLTSVFFSIRDMFFGSKNNDAATADNPKQNRVSAAEKAPPSDPFQSDSKTRGEEPDLQAEDRETETVEEIIQIDTEEPPSGGASLGNVTTQEVQDDSTPEKWPRSDSHKQGDTITASLSPVAEEPGEVAGVAAGLHLPRPGGGGATRGEEARDASEAPQVPEVPQLSKVAEEHMQTEWNLGSSVQDIDSPLFEMGRVPEVFTSAAGQVTADVGETDTLQDHDQTDPGELPCGVEPHSGGSGEISMDTKADQLLGSQNTGGPDDTPECIASLTVDTDAAEEEGYGHAEKNVAGSETGISQVDFSDLVDNEVEMRKQEGPLSTAQEMEVEPISEMQEKLREDDIDKIITVQPMTVELKLPDVSQPEEGYRHAAKNVVGSGKGISQVNSSDRVDHEVEMRKEESPLSTAQKMEVEPIPEMREKLRKDDIDKIITVQPMVVELKLPDVSQPEEIMKVVPEVNISPPRIPDVLDTVTLHLTPPNPESIVTELPQEETAICVPKTYVLESPTEPKPLNEKSGPQLLTTLDIASVESKPASIMENTEKQEVLSTKQVSQQDQEQTMFKENADWKNIDQIEKETSIPAINVCLSDDSVLWFDPEPHRVKFPTESKPAVEKQSQVPTFTVPLISVESADSPPESNNLSKHTVKEIESPLVQGVSTNLDLKKRSESPSLVGREDISPPASVSKITDVKAPAKPLVVGVPPENIVFSRPDATDMSPNVPDKLMKKTPPLISSFDQQKPQKEFQTSVEPQSFVSRPDVTDVSFSVPDKLMKKTPPLISSVDQQKPQKEFQTSVEPQSFVSRPCVTDVSSNVPDNLMKKTPPLISSVDQQKPQKEFQTSVEPQSFVSRPGVTDVSFSVPDNLMKKTPPTISSLDQQKPQKEFQISFEPQSFVSWPGVTDVSSNVPDNLMKKTPPLIPSLDQQKPQKEFQTSVEPQSFVDQLQKDKSAIEKRRLAGPEQPMLSPATLRRFAAKGLSGPEAPVLMVVPAIQVDNFPSGEVHTEEVTGAESPPAVRSCETSPRLRRKDSPTLIPSATPEELALGARRKIFLAKSKGEVSEGAEKEELQKRKMPSQEQEQPYLSPTLSRKAALLQPSTRQQTPPTERRSPHVIRKATLEVPKRPEELMEETDSAKTDDKPADKETLNPFKAPQVIRKIRGEPFPDALGHLKLWCQFFNVLSDSMIKWNRDDVEIAAVKRSAGDESQVALAIVQTSSRDCGVYACSIKNEYGTDTTDFLLSADILSNFLLREDLEVGEEIEMTPMIFTKGLADPGYWGDKFFGRIMIQEAHVGEGYAHKACRVKVIYGLEPVFESGSSCIIKVRNPIAYSSKDEISLAEINLEITKKECKIQNTAREYCKVFAAEARVIENFGPSLEMLPRYLMYRPANTVPYATVEVDVPGVYLKYCTMDAAGRLTMRSVSEVEQKCCAFQHWIHQWTNGNLLVTQLEGIGMRITNIGVATKLKGYQALPDCWNPQVFEQFAVQHQCNYYCGLLGLRTLKPTDSLPQTPKIKGSRSPLLNRRAGPSSSPQLPKKGAHSPQTTRKAASSPKVSRKSESGDGGKATPKPKTATEGSKAVGTR